MTKLLVLYYSSYGHVAQLAEAIAEGARNGGAEVDIRRVPETAPKEIVEQAGFRANDDHKVIGAPDEMADYDGIVVGTPTRYGRMSGQMAAFWDTTGGLWKKGALVGKAGAAFTSTGSQHGGQEMTQFSTITNLMHMGMVIVPLDYGYRGLLAMDEMTGGSPYGASTVAGADGSRQPSENELGACRYHGEKIAQVAAKLAG